MTEYERLFNAVGLSRKAGKCVSGDEAVEKSVRANRALLVVLDAAASENTQARYAALCAGRGIPWIKMERLGDAIGKPTRRIAAVTDRNFQKMITDAHAAFERQRTASGVEA